MRALGLLLIAFASVPLASCGREFETPNVDDTSCKPDQAQLSVREGYMRRTCGCAEGSGRVDPSEPANCTVSAGTTVFFSFASSNGPHQILSVGTPSFKGSGLSDPRGVEVAIRSYAVTFGNVGSYFFMDAFHNEVRGSIIVQ